MSHAADSLRVDASAPANTGAAGNRPAGQLRVEPDTARMAQFGVSLTQIEEAVRDFSSNAGGFIDLNGREYLIRHVGRTRQIEDLQGLAVAWADGRPIMVTQVAAVRFAPALKRGDAGYQ